jgi:hypothetical protein
LARRQAAHGDQVVTTLRHGSVRIDDPARGEGAAHGEDPSFAGGRYADKVLTVHSNAPDEALEEPDSPYRIVVSVGMLKVGWDVKSVYVIASLRASSPTC